MKQKLIAKLHQKCSFEKLQFFHPILFYTISFAGVPLLALGAVVLSTAAITLPVAFFMGYL